MSATPPKHVVVRLRRMALRIDGLSDFSRAIRGLDEQLPKEMQGTNKKVVEDLVVPRARAGAEAARPTSGYNARTGRSPYHWADVVNSIRALASRDSASIAMGSTAHSKSWMLGYEFGSRRELHPPTAKSPHANTLMFPRSPGTKTNAGRFFFPAIRSSGPDIVDAYQKALDGLIARTKEFQTGD